MSKSRTREIMENEIMVSVCCMAYNQEDYIRDALEGFVMQKANFTYEVLVHDDASTDGTADIIREYEKKYPDLIKPIYQTENQYSKGIPVGELNWKRAKGKYIAECEGDDYWTDPHKLQKQFDAMERHPEVNMCNHATRNVQADNKRIIDINSKADKETVFTFEQILLTRGSRVGDTCSFFYRKSILDNEYEFWVMDKHSSYLSILGAIGAGILYLPDCMATYRVGAKGSWSSRMNVKEKWGERAADKRGKIELLDVLNKDTNGKYEEAIRIAKDIAEIEALEYLQDYKAMRQPKYKEALKHFPRFYIAKVWAHKQFPWLGNVKRWIKG